MVMIITIIRLPNALLFQSLLWFIIRKNILIVQEHV